MQVLQPTMLPGWHTVKEVAVMLKLSEKAVYNRLYRGKYAVAKAGRTILISDDVVLRLYVEVRDYKRR